MKNDTNVVQFKNVVVMQLRFKPEEYDRFKKVIEKIRKVWYITGIDRDMINVSESVMAKMILLCQIDVIESKNKGGDKDEKEG